MTATAQARPRDIWARICEECSTHQLDRMRTHHQGKLDHPGPRAGERARKEHTRAVQALSAEIARRATEPPLNVIVSSAPERRNTPDEP
jgi:hypothetical protein